MNHAANVPDHLTDGQAMLESDQFPTQGVVSVLNKSSSSNDLQHTWACASRRGAVCDCDAWRTRIDPDLIHDHVGEEGLILPMDDLGPDWRAFVIAKWAAEKGQPVDRGRLLMAYRAPPRAASPTN